MTLYKGTIFIISKRRELAIKYKKLLEAINQEVHIISDLSTAFKEFPNLEPELIIISDTIGEELDSLCKKIRVLTFNFRPSIIAISKSSETSDRLKILEAGADDFLSELIPSGEFQARIKAHLRRHVENSLNDITYFVQKNLTVKYIKRVIENDKKNAIILIDIFALNLYREIYGEIACEKVLQTMASIINSTLSEGDFIGHHTGNEFIMVTNCEKAEMVASFLVFAFDNVLERFYSEEDFKNKFILYSSDEKIENKIPLMRLGVAVVEVEKNKFKDYRELLNKLYMTLKLCKKVEKSSYFVDRPQLQGEKIQKNEKKILISENDEALSYLLQAVCKIKGYTPFAINDDEDFMETYNKINPEVVIIDYGREDTKEGIERTKSMKQKDRENVKIIFSSSIYNKKEILGAGADLYLPKPYDIDTLMEWVEKFFE